LAMKSQQLVKTLRTCRKINAILTNIKANLPKLANISGYKLTKKSAKFYGNLIGLSKNIRKKVCGLLF